MSHQADTAALSAPARTPPNAVRPFYWSLRREIWENRAVYLAPAIVAALMVAAVVVNLSGLPQRVLAAAPADAGKAHALLMLPYAGGGAAVILTGIVVAVFYALGSLNGERRDRSILFWKSLPVSDRVAVAAKATVALVIQPLVVVAIIIVAHALMVALSVAVLAANGVDPAPLWDGLHLPLMWFMLTFGLAMNALWWAPIVGWLMLVSAWARRTTFLWAIVPPLGLCLAEFLTLHTTRLWGFLMYRLNDGLRIFSVDGLGKKPLEHLSQLNAMPMLTNLDLWLGLAAAGGFYAGCVWLRRRGDPL